MHGRHAAIPVIVLVKQYGLVKLQFEFASDIDAESHMGVSPEFNEGLNGEISGNGAIGSGRRRN
jgi:hypothetical protein